MQLKSFQAEFPYIVKALLSARKSGRLAHSFIIQSDDNALADAFATALAQAVTCQSSEADGDACGRCPTCRQLEGKTYSELYSLAPASKSRQILIGEDDPPEPNSMRWFISQFHMKSAMGGGVKTGIIYEADCMNPNSQNCFLKTLEEPPPSSFIMLITANPFSLIPTIRSRCQNILLLRNRISYSDEKIFGIVSILDSLLLGNATIANAEGCATRMIAVSDGLHDAAEAKMKVKWKKTFEDSKFLEPPAQKRLEKRFEAEIESEYIKMRDSMLSLIHTWSSEAYMLSCGIPASSLSNPELFPVTASDFKLPDQKKAYWMMRKSEDLLQILNWNVNDDLAFREFCMSVVFGK